MRASAHGETDCDERADEHSASRHESSVTCRLAGRRTGRPPARARPDSPRRGSRGSSRRRSTAARPRVERDPAVAVHRVFDGGRRDVDPAARRHLEKQKSNAMRSHRSAMRSASAASASSTPAARCNPGNAAVIASSPPTRRWTWSATIRSTTGSSPLGANPARWIASQRSRATSPSRPRRAGRSRGRGA